MLNRIMLAAGTLALFIGAFAGCQEATQPVTPTTDDGLLKNVSTLVYTVDLPRLADANRPPSYEQAIGEGRQLEPTRGNEGLTVEDYKRILNQLRLTERQTAAIRLCFGDYDDCSANARKRYDAAIQGLREKFNADVARLKAAVAGGTMSAEEARRTYNALTERFQAAGSDLARGYQARLAECKAELERCIKSNLTPEQIRRWNQLAGRKEAPQGR